MRAMYPKSPAKRRWEYAARTSCRQGAFSPSEALRSCTAHESCHPLMDLALAQGLLPEQLHHRIAFQRLGPCPGVPAPQRPADTRHLPMPATRCTHHSQRQAADGLRRRSSGAWPAVRPSPEGPPTASSRRAGRQRSAAQNRRLRPQARPGLRQRCQKRPSKGRVPLGGAIGTPPPKRRVSANSIACAFASAHKGRIRQNTYHRLGNTSLKHDAPPSSARTNRYRFSVERRWQPNLQA